MGKPGGEKSADSESRRTDFLREIVQADLQKGTHGGKVLTRFPPEPNGYLHIGHAKSICINFGIAKELGDGRCNLRYDDTNPAKEDTEYVDSILNDIRWLGFDPGENIFFASDYFEQLYLWAEELVENGKAYVCSLNDEEVREYRGTVMESGKPSPDRNRPMAESLELLRRMRAGEFPDGKYTLRAKIDMANPNMKMRDPPLYRIRHQHHHRTGDDWCIYPFYDFAHGLSDAIEGITHSICTLEFENNRELYDWLVDAVSTSCKPRQYEFARLSLTYCLMSKRKLLKLVEEGVVGGWDDPRMPTISGMRRRGVTASAIRTFCDRIGVAKTNSQVDMAILDAAIREDLNPKSPRYMAVLSPLKLVIENVEEGWEEVLDAPSFPSEFKAKGSRALPFSREILIERDDFMETPTKGFRRLAPGREVRLRHAWLLTCTGVIKNDSGEVIELRGRIDPDTLGVAAPDGRKVRGTIHWVSANHAIEGTVRLYDRLVSHPSPGAGDVDFHEHLNPESLVELKRAMLEPALGDLKAGTHVQFERTGFFYTDPQDHGSESLVFNRVIALKDSWAKHGLNEPKVKPQPRVEPPKSAKEPTGPRVYPKAVQERIDRLTGQYDLALQAAAGLAQSPALTEFFEDTVQAGSRPNSAASWVLGEVRKVIEGDGLEPLRFGPFEVAELISLVEASRVSNRNAKDIFEVMARESGQPEQIMAALNLESISDQSQLAVVIDQVMAQHPDAVSRFRDGERKLQGFLMGQVMRAMHGKADAREVGRLLRERLED